MIIADKMRVIGRLSKRKTAIYVGLSTMFIVGGISIILFHPNGFIAGGFDERNISSPIFATLGGAAFIYLGLIQIKILKRILTDDLKAIWLNENRLFYINLNSILLEKNIELTKISSFEFSSGLSSWIMGIVVNLTDGKSEAIPTLILGEPRSIMLHKLRELLIVAP